jgi:hypothetical protein
LVRRLIREERSQRELEAGEDLTAFEDALESFGSGAVFSKASYHDRPEPSSLAVLVSMRYA